MQIDDYVWLVVRTLYYYNISIIEIVYRRYTK